SGKGLTLVTRFSSLIGRGPMTSSGGRKTTRGGGGRNRCKAGARSCFLRPNFLQPWPRDGQKTLFKLRISRDSYGIRLFAATHCLPTTAKHAESWLSTCLEYAVNCGPRQFHGSRYSGDSLPCLMHCPDSAFLFLCESNAG